MGQKIHFGEGAVVSENLLEHARDALTSEIHSRQDQAAGELGSVAQAMRQTGQEIHRQRGDVSSGLGFLDKAAGQVDRMAENLKSMKLATITDDVRRFARKKPFLFLGGAFAVGVLVSRFVKASSHAERGRRSSSL